MPYMITQVLHMNEAAYRGVCRYCVTVLVSLGQRLDGALHDYASVTYE